MPNEPRRIVYLLIMWCERTVDRGRPALWRFSLEDMRTEQRLGFASLQTLMAYLQAQMAATGDAAEEDAVWPSGDSHFQSGCHLTDDG